VNIDTATADELYRLLLDVQDSPCKPGTLTELLAKHPAD
jgi:hypothetical protein